MCTRPIRIINQVIITHQKCYRSPRPIVGLPCTGYHVSQDMENMLHFYIAPVTCHLGNPSTQVHWLINMPNAHGQGGPGFVCCLKEKLYPIGSQTLLNLPPSHKSISP